MTIAPKVVFVHQEDGRYFASTVYENAYEAYEAYMDNHIMPFKDHDVFLVPGRNGERMEQIGIGELCKWVEDDFLESQEFE